MRASVVVAVCLVGSLMSGCGKDTRTEANRRADTEMVRTINNLGVENAILAQHTLYPYHFVLDGAQLNELGQRDFGVLARHFLDHPGLLNIRQGEGIAPELYQARVAYVTNQLKQAGVESGRVSVSDDAAAGPGMRSEEVVTIVERAPRPSAKPALGDRGAGAGSWGASTR